MRSENQCSTQAKFNNFILVVPSQARPNQVCRSAFEPKIIGLAHCLGTYVGTLDIVGPLHWLYKRRLSEQYPEKVSRVLMGCMIDFNLRAKGPIS